MDYFVTTYHWFVPYTLIWSDWFREDEFYYDVWF